MKGIIRFLLCNFWFLFLPGAFCQISPGKLAAVHSHLEGISKCTLCHTLGNKITNDKCLACHTEIRKRIDQNQGFHASAEIRGKNCTACHSDHHGENFQIVRFDKNKFNHGVTGFDLTGAHASKACADCHRAEHIKDPAVKSKKFTYLGVSRECLNCHTDYHQGTLSQTCTNCHSGNAFKPAAKFSHVQTRYPLKGMHQSVACTSCHKITQVNGKKFQQFRGVAFANCNNCHEDPHKGNFGSGCSQCHSETSFHSVRGISNFDHSKTSFPLENSHKTVACQSCHKNKYGVAIKHDRCSDCHQDFHQQQFMKNRISPDCSDCHGTTSFSLSSFTQERHNLGNFVLKGAHAATACPDCHKKQGKWNFRQIGIRCNDCHTDIHESLINSKYYPDKNCRNCHNEEGWKQVQFDHDLTTFRLTGAHASKPCGDCHFKTDASGKVHQKFQGMGKECSGCHEDNHNSQFLVDGKTDCSRCHQTSKWNIDSFDHDKTNFHLDGKHKNVPCSKCHKPVKDQEKSFILYKIKDFRCENCH
ncbi:MAG: hypothetical protein ACM3N9_01705 [Syntrophothermus sp.]